MRNLDVRVLELLYPIAGENPIGCIRYLSLKSGASIQAVSAAGRRLSRRGLVERIERPVGRAASSYSGRRMVLYELTEAGLDAAASIVKHNDW